MQKQSSRGVLGKRCSENMQQIYRRTPMPKCDFNKVACNHWVAASVSSIIYILANVLFYSGREIPKRYHQDREE